jgi:hypothetical protein
MIVIPAKAGIHLSTGRYADEWIPAVAGMTFLDGKTRSIDPVNSAPVG